ITSLKWLETNNLFNNLIQRNQSAAFSSGKVRPNHETNINIIARRTGKDVNSHTVLDGIITTIMATIQRINIIGSREGSRNRRRLKANQTGKKFRVGIKSNISTNRNNLISGVDRCIHLNAMKKTYFATFRHQLTILSKTDALDEEKWLNMLGTFVKDWFRYESHFVHGRDSLVDILKERGLLSESDAVQPLIGKKS